MSGKTTLAKRLAQAASSAGRLVFVLDPLLDPDWKEYGADFVTKDAALFLQQAKVHKNCTLLIDEAGEFCSNHDREMFWLATQSRHWGHQAIFMGQRANMIARNIRDNCSKIFCFRISPADAKLMVEDFCFKELIEAPELPQGVCIYAPRYGSPTRINIFQNKD